MSLLNGLNRQAKFLVTVVILVGFIVSLIVQPVFALSQADLDAINGNWVNWDPASGPNLNSTCGSSLGGSLDQFMQAIAIQESGGNITAGSPAHASGKYQFEPATWNSWAKDYYQPAQQYQYASAAPQQVQDAVMYLGFIAIYKSQQGNIFNMAVEHYYPAALNNSSLLNIVPYGGNSLTPRQYADIIVGGVNSGLEKGTSLSSISLTYTGAPDFQTWLAKDGGSPTTSSTLVSQQNTSCGGIILGNVIFYNQCNPSWGNTPYGSPGSTICSSGCGPTSVAMVVSSLSSSTVSPSDVASWSMSNGGWVPGQGSSWNGLLVMGPEHWGLNAQNIGTNFNKALATLEGGGLVIAAGTGAAPFTTAGHILVLRGVASDGNILVADPDSAHTSTEYSATTIISAGLQDLVAVTK